MKSTIAPSSRPSGIPSPLSVGLATVHASVMGWRCTSPAWPCCGQSRRQQDYGFAGPDMHVWPDFCASRRQRGCHRQSDGPQRCSATADLTVGQGQAQSACQGIPQSQPGIGLARLRNGFSRYMAKIRAAVMRPAAEESSRPVRVVGRSHHLAEHSGLTRQRAQLRMRSAKLPGIERHGFDGSATAGFPPSRAG